MPSEVAQWDWPKAMDAEFKNRFAVDLTTTEVAPAQFVATIDKGGAPTPRQMEFIRGFMSAVMCQQVRG